MTDLKRTRPEPNRLLDHWHREISALLAARDRATLDGVARAIGCHAEALQGAERRRCNELHLRALAGVRWLRPRASRLLRVR